MLDILAVDDSDFIRSVVQALCEKHGWSYAGATSLAAGREALHANPPSILILDFHLPDGRGVELVKDVQDRAATTILGLSMQPRDYAKQRYADVGVDIVLDKEVVLRNELENILVKILSDQAATPSQNQPAT